MLIPQGMAYALIAGLPPVYGLYAALAPIVIYAFLGTSRQLGVGPVAMVSLIVAAGIAPLAGGDPVLYISLALLLSLMVGVMQLLFGIARFGFLTSFLSQPVLSGFVTAGAIIIALSQLRNVLGVDLVRSNHLHIILFDAVRQLGNVHGTTLLLGALGVGFLVLVKRWRPTAPAALILVVITTALSWWLDLPAKGVQIVGSVPGGLPAFSIPHLSLENLVRLLPAALAITLVGYVESIAISKVYASKQGYEIDPNRELIALGLANMVGAFFRAYPTTGSFSRTAVNDQAGARTNVAGFYSAGLIALTLLFVTDLFTYLPMATLGAVVIAAVARLVDVKEVFYLWKVDRKDFGLLVLTAFATLFIGIEIGILVGVAASLIVVVQQSSRPYTAVIGRLPGTQTYRNINRFSEARAIPGVLVFRIDAQLFFGNVGHIREKLGVLVDAHPEVHTIVLDCYPINQIDSTGIRWLEQMTREFGEREVSLVLAGIKGPFMDKLTDSGLVDTLGEDAIFEEVHDAVVSRQRP
jgi:SulP family sulfate permease